MTNYVCVYITISLSISKEMAYFFQHRLWDVPHKATPFAVCNVVQIMISNIKWNREPLENNYAV